MAARVQALGQIALNDVFREETTGKLYRVVSTGRGRLDTLLIDIRSDRTEVISLSTWELCRRAAPAYEASDRFTRVDDPYAVFRAIVCDTAGHVAQGHENWRCIKELVEDPDALYKTLSHGSQRKRILTEHGKRVDASEKKMRHLHRLFLQRGMCERAVASDLFKCGRTVQLSTYSGEEEPKRIKRRYRKRPGRKPKNPGHFACPSQLLNRLLRQYADLYLTSDVGRWQEDVDPRLIRRIRKAQKRGDLPEIRKRRRKRTASQARQSGRRRRTSSIGRAGKRKRITMEYCVDHLNYVTRCVKQVRDESGQIIELELAPFDEVTVRQFQHYYLTNVPRELRKRRQMGEREYSYSGRPKRGHALQHSRGPGTQYLIDATVADVYVVSRFNRTVVVGRPTIYLCMDLFSRMIVGFHVTLEPPSFDGVALVLESIVTPKVELCARYGLTITRDLWPCEFLPLNDFLADRGSDFMKVESWKAANRDLAVAISNARARDPTPRGLVERRFGTVPCRYQRASYGVVEHDVATRCAPRYSWDAIHTVSEITKKLIRAILIHNDQPIAHGGAISDLVEAGVPDTPLNRWNYGIEKMSGSLQSRSVDDVRLATWPHDEAKPTDKGLLWKGVYYTSPYIQSTLIHVWGKHGKDRVPIQHNPDNMSMLLLHGAGYLEYAVPYETNPVLPGECSQIEWNLYRAQSRSVNARKRRENQPSRVMEQLNNAEEGEKARKEQKAALKKAGLKHPKTTDMRSARAAEVAVERASRGYGVFAISRKPLNGKRGEQRSDNRPDVNPGEVDDARVAMRKQAMADLRRVNRKHA